MFEEQNFGSQEAEIEHMGIQDDVPDLYNVSVVFEGALEEFFSFNDYSEAMEKYDELVAQYEIDRFENDWHKFVIEISLYDTFENVNKEFKCFEPDRESIHY